MTKIVNDILSLIGEFRNQIPTETTGDSADWHPEHSQKIESLVRQNRPIHMVLPAFPAKSPNPKKTVGHRPDYGEVLALSRLNELCRKIGEIHGPGARLTVCSDGRVFSDVVGVSDDLVNLYAQEVRSILAEHELHHLDLFGLEDLYAGYDYNRMRRRLMDEFGEELESLKGRVRTQLESRFLFNGIHRFMYEDQLEIQPGQSRNQSREKAKDLAYEVILRSNAWSRLVEKHFPEAVRLSIHPQPALSNKIGVRLLPSEDMWRTPWHSVAVFNGRDFYLAPRAQVERAGGTLRYARNRYAYYVLEAEQGLRVAP